MVHILNCFTAVSGQRINLQKYGLICGNKVPPPLQLALSSILQIPIWDSPGKYLGIPAEWGVSRGQTLNWIKERLFSKLEGWKDNFLSQAGKEVLIKSVIQVIPSYVMEILRLPKNFLSIIVRCCG